MLTGRPRDGRCARKLGAAARSRRFAATTASPSGRSDTPYRHGAPAFEAWQERRERRGRGRQPTIALTARTCVAPPVRPLPQVPESNVPSRFSGTVLPAHLLEAGTLRLPHYKQASGAREAR